MESLRVPASQLSYPFCSPPPTIVSERYTPLLSSTVRFKRASSLALRSWNKHPAVGQGKTMAILEPIT